MKILISNDDGFQAAGIVALYEALKDVAEVEVIAPEINNSAKSNALTLNSPLYVQRASNGFRYVNGTPADCVHVALSGLLDYRPDLVVSGINVHRLAPFRNQAPPEFFNVLLIAFGLLPSDSVTQSAQMRSAGASGKRARSAAW